MMLPQEINGYPVIQAGIVSEDFWIVLCRRDNSPFEGREYITWAVTGEGGKYYAEHGHYDMELDQARKDWAERMARYRQA
jgi:hypothetical protein